MQKLNNWLKCLVTITLALFNAPWLPLIKNHAQGAKVRAGYKKQHCHLHFGPTKTQQKSVV